MKLLLITILFLSFNMGAFAMSDEALFSDLMQAYTSSNGGKLQKLLDENKQQIKTAFPKWLKVPENVRKDQAKSSEYVNLIMLMVNYYEKKGDTSLKQLAGIENKDNPVTTWGRDLNIASQELNTNPQKSISLLEPYIKEFKNGRGTAMDEYMAKTLGVLGVAYFRVGNNTLAIKYLEEAKAECARTGDTEGVKAYSDNLKQLKEIIGKNP